MLWLQFIAEPTVRINTPSGKEVVWDCVNQLELTGILGILFLFELDIRHTTTVALQVFKGARN